MRRRKRLRNGEAVAQGRCPKCGTWEDLDRDQLEGKVSSQCSVCDWHETIRWLDHPEELR